MTDLVTFTFGELRLVHWFISEHLLPCIPTRRPTNMNLAHGIRPVNSYSAV